MFDCSFLRHLQKRLGALDTQPGEKFVGRTFDALLKAQFQRPFRHPKLFGDIRNVKLLTQIISNQIHCLLDQSIAAILSVGGLARDYLVRVENQVIRGSLRALSELKKKLEDGSDE